MTTPGGEVAALADGLWRRLRDVLLAERQLERFAFAPDAERDTGLPRRLTALLEGAEALEDLARDVALRALAAAADGVNYRVLRRLAHPGVTLDDLAGAVGLTALAVSERVNALAQVGLAARELDRDAIVDTPAGRAVVGLVEAVGAEVAARCRAGAGSLR
jgi:hypothetical protein